MTVREEARQGLIYQFQKETQMASTRAELLEPLIIFFASILSPLVYEQLLLSKNFANTL